MLSPLSLPECLLRLRDALALHDARDELGLGAAELEALGAQVGLQLVHAQRAQVPVIGQRLGAPEIRVIGRGYA